MNVLPQAMVSFFQKINEIMFGTCLQSFLFRGCDFVGVRLHVCVFLRKGLIICNYSGSSFQPARIMN